MDWTDTLVDSLKIYIEDIVSITTNYSTISA